MLQGTHSDSCSVILTLLVVMKACNSLLLFTVMFSMFTQNEARSARYPWMINDSLMISYAFVPLSENCVARRSIWNLVNFLMDPTSMPWVPHRSSSILHAPGLYRARSAYLDHVEKCGQKLSEKLWPRRLRWKQATETKRDCHPLPCFHRSPGWFMLIRQIWRFMASPIFSGCVSEFDGY